MTDLSTFTNEEKELLASLPYKVGIWVSYTDDVDGEGDDRNEIKALEHCLNEFARQSEGRPLVSSVIKETFHLKAKWAVWADQSFHVLKDVEKAVGVIKAKGTPQDYKAFRAVIMEIAAAVAQAHGEFSHFDDEEAKTIFSKIIGKLASLAEDDKGHPMNVSAAEDSALSKLAAALKI